MIVKPENLNVGDIFYECYNGMNVKLKVIRKPEFITSVVNGKRKWSWVAITLDGEVIDYSITEGLEHYGPKIYSIPMYGYIENDEIKVKVE